MEKETLIRLQQEIGKKPVLEEKIAELYERRSACDRRVISLRAAYRQKQEEADRLEKRSFASYALRLTGKMEEKREQVQKEVREAEEAMAAAEREMEQIKQEIREVQSILAGLRVAEQKYIELLQKRRMALRESDTETGRQIRALEQQIQALEVQKAEIQEALSVGNRARGTAMRILSELDDADGWNTWDMVGGGGLITHMAKHGHLDEAQGLINELKSDLRKFQKELEDIRIHAELQVNVEGFLRFADWFFDGLFVDWAVGKKIGQSQEAVQRTKDQISHTLGKLENMKTATQQQIEAMKQQLEELTANI